MIYQFLANGFEDIEALAPVDILRRGGLEVRTVSITGSEFVESAHGVTVRADVTFEDAGDFADADMLLLPRWGLKNYEFVNRLNARLNDKHNARLNAGPAQRR